MVERGHLRDHPTDANPCEVRGRLPSPPAPRAGNELPHLQRRAQPPTGDSVTRVDLSRESIRLGRVLTELMPDEPEAVGLLAVMLLKARRPARTATDGSMVRLADQDRTQWDRMRTPSARETLATPRCHGRPHWLAAISRAVMR